MNSSPFIASSRIGSCAPPKSSGSGFSSLTGSDPPEERLSESSNDGHSISLVSSRFRVDVVHVVLSVRNCTIVVL